MSEEERPSIWPPPGATPKPSKPRFSKQHPLILVGIVAAVIALVAVLAALAPDEKPDPVVKANYARWRAECEDYATGQVYGTPYDVGGNHWASIVNKCLVDKASD